MFKVTNIDKSDSEMCPPRVSCSSECHEIFIPAKAVLKILCNLFFSGTEGVKGTVQHALTIE